MSGEPVWSGFGQHVELHLDEQARTWTVKTAAGGELVLSYEAIGELVRLLDEAKITAPAQLPEPLREQPPAGNRVSNREIPPAPIR